MSRIVIAGSSAYDVDASSASRRLPSPTRPPLVDPAERTHLCAGIAIGGGTATIGSDPGDADAGSTAPPVASASGLAGVGVGEGDANFDSSLATAGTICFDVRLGAGDRAPTGADTLRSTADVGVATPSPIAVGAFLPTGVPLSLAVRNRLPAALAPAAPNRDFFLALSATTRPNLELGLSGVDRPLPSLPRPPPSSPPLALGLSRASSSLAFAPRNLDFPRAPTFGANDDARRACFAVFPSVPPFLVTARPPSSSPASFILPGSFPRSLASPRAPLAPSPRCVPSSRVDPSPRGFPLRARETPPMSVRRRARESRSRARLNFHAFMSTMILSTRRDGLDRASRARRPRVHLDDGAIPTRRVARSIVDVANAMRCTVSGRFAPPFIRARARERVDGDDARAGERGENLARER